MNAMIVTSTPSSIVWQSPDGRRITFHGEWTLEPKFYLDVSNGITWDGTESSERLAEQEAKVALDGFLRDAKERGWTIIVE
jgi:hypothetical protein